MKIIAKTRTLPGLSGNMAVWLILFFASLRVGAADRPGVVLTDEKGRYRVGSHLEILEDPARQLTLGDVASPAMASRFMPSTSNRVSLGSTAWVRLRIFSEASSRTDWRLVIRTGRIDYVDLYAPGAAGEDFRASRAGDALPFSSREIPDRQYAFYLPSSAAPPEGAGYTIYLHLENSGPVIFYPIILSARSFHELRQKEMLLFGIFHGAMLLAIAAHLVTFLLTRESSYLYYASFIFICVLILALIEGLIQQYVWPRHLVLPSETLLLLLGVTVPLLLAFGSSFLQTEKRLPRLHAVIRWLLILCVVWFVLFPFLSHEIMIQVVKLLDFMALVVIVTGGLLSWRRGNRPARYFSIAWLVFLGVYFVTVTGASQLVSDDSTAVFIAIHLSVALTTLVFALALADRVKWQRERSDRERERLFSELEAKNAELERFTYSVSHDLKSPLVTIKGFLGFLKKDVSQHDEEKAADDISRIESAADSMSRLLDDLLELSRIGRVIHTLERVSLDVLIQEALEISSGRIEKAGARVHVEGGLPSLWCDRKRMAEVFQNLIDNAVKFAGDGREPLVEIGARDEGDTVHCYVKDNGRGIPSKYHDKVFDLFERLDAENEGTGIGLALVKRIVEEHRGQVRVESEGVGHGSTFWLVLPKNRPEASEEAS